MGHSTTLLPNRKVGIVKGGEFTDAERKGERRKLGKRGGVKHYHEGPDTDPYY